MVPTMQMGQVLTGSPTVTAGGKPVATSSSQVPMCARSRASRWRRVTDVTVA